MAKALSKTDHMSKGVKVISRPTQLAYHFAITWPMGNHFRLTQAIRPQCNCDLRIVTSGDASLGSLVNLWSGYLMENRRKLTWILHYRLVQSHGFSCRLSALKIIISLSLQNKFNWISRFWIIVKMPLCLENNINTFLLGISYK